MGLVTYLCICLAALGAVWAFNGLAAADPPASLKGVGTAAFWGLVAALNEHLRARGRQRRGEE